jgi:hypothetical protein
MRMINAAADRLLSMLVPRAEASACVCTKTVLKCQCTDGKQYQDYAYNCSCPSVCCPPNQGCKWYGATC